MGRHVRNGLTQIHGKKISIITKQSHIAVVGFDEIGVLSSQTYEDIPCGGIKTSIHSYGTF